MTIALASTAAAGAAQPPAKDDRKVAAQQLEAFFLRQLLQEARPESADGGFAGDTFKQMLDEQLADKMSASGGIGLAKILAPSLGTVSHMEPLSTAPSGEAGLAAAPGEGSMCDTVPVMIAPIVGRPTSGYGLRKDPIHGTEQRHPGVDLAAPVGTPVGAAAGGKVTHAGPAGTYGNLVIVQHDNGYETRYAHLSEVSVREGERVTPGELVGKVGTTGYSTGPHLHFEVRHDGKVLDPQDLLHPLNRSGSRSSR